MEFDVACPHCDADIVMESDVGGAVVADCPECGEEIEVDFPHSDEGPGESQAVRTSGAANPFHGGMSDTEHQQKYGGHRETKREGEEDLAFVSVIAMVIVIAALIIAVIAAFMYMPEAGAVAVGFLGLWLYSLTRGRRFWTTSFRIIRIFT